MKNARENNYKDNFCIFVFLTFFVMVLQYVFTEYAHFEDDYYFSTVLDNQNLLVFLKTRYLNWSSRLLTDALLVIVTHQSALVWKILHSLVVLFTVTGIAEITIPQNKKEYVFIVPMLFAFMPVAVFNDTGWMATTLNYAWPLAACMPFFVILKKSLAGEEKTITRFFYIFSFILLFYGCNQEQMCAVVFASSVLMIICTVYENRGKVFSLAGVNRYYIFTLVLSALFFLLIILCPGNSIRFESEVNTWYPDYVNLNIFQKLDAGFLITMTYFFTFTEVWSKGGVFTPNYLILPLFIIMAVNFLSKKKHVFSICTVLLAVFHFSSAICRAQICSKTIQ